MSVEEEARGQQEDDDRAPLVLEDEKPIDEDPDGLDEPDDEDDVDLDEDEDVPWNDDGADDFYGDMDDD